MSPPIRSALVVFLVLLVSPAARADPWLPGQENAIDDQLADGDIDEQDVVTVSPVGLAGLAGAHGESWVSLVGFTKQLASGQNDVGGMVVVGLALDRLAAGPGHRLTDPARPERPVSSSPGLAPSAERADAPSSGVDPAAASAKDVPAPPAPPPPARPNLVLPSLARSCVAAALRASGLGMDDTRLDALVARARASAWLPEARMRAMRLITDAARAATLATTDGTNYYETVGAHLVLELRLTWRLDRLLYAGDEPALERARLERHDARSRLAVRTLDALFAWQRAVVDIKEALVGSREEGQAWLRASEAQATLDVLTDGWFSKRGQ
jgi:hypothetical protein